MKKRAIVTTVKGCDNKKQKTISKDILGSSMMKMGEDTIAEIFMWLPLKSIFTFKSLSKRWFYLISSKDSYFHNEFISTMGNRNRKRIVGRGNNNPNPIMLGSIFQNCMPFEYGRPQYLPTSVELLKYTNGDHVQNHFTLDCQVAAKSCSSPFTLDRPTDFLLNHLAFDDYDISVVGSSNGFLLCSLPGGRHYLIANPITKELEFLPETKTLPRFSNISFVCKGDYPHLASVEYTIVRLGSYSTPDGSTTSLGVEVLYNGDEEWRKFDITTFEPQCKLEFWRNNMVITTSDQGRGTETTTVYAPCEFYHKALSFELEKKKKLIMRDDKKQQLVGMITKLPKMDGVDMCNSHHLEEVDGAMHYLQLYGTHIDSIRLGVWVLTDNKEWYLKHMVYMGNTIREAQWINHKQWGMEDEKWTVEGFHPLNPDLILLTIFHKKVWYNVDTQTVELVADFSVQNLRHSSVHFAYQWPCWPPLL